MAFRAVMLRQVTNRSSDIGARWMSTWWRNVEPAAKSIGVVTEDYRAEIFILAGWSLWNRRNAVRLNRPTHPLDQTISVAGGLLQEYINAQPNLPTPDQLPTTHQWRSPDHPRFKANFDGAVFNNINAAGIGVVIRDSNAAVIGALSRRIPLPQTEEEVEVLACRQVVKLAREIGIREVVFEGDSAIIVQALKHGQADQSVYGHILDDVTQQTSQFLLWAYP